MEELYKLSKKEIAQAIVSYIGVYRRGQSFFPYRIKETDCNLKLNDEVIFTLEYIPKGSLTGDVNDNI